MKYCPHCARKLTLKKIEGINRLGCPKNNCAFVFWDNPIPVVGYIVETSEGVVLGHNRLWPAGIYSIFSGFLERGETPEDAVIREIAEELGLQSVVISLVGVYPFLERNQVIIVYHVKSEGKLLLSSEIDEIRIYSREELKDWPFGQEKLKGWPFGAGWAIRDWLSKTNELSGIT